MVEFRTLETFVSVATLGSFRGAAKKLHTTQPAISQRIAQLEASLGVSLFDRRHRRVGLTPTGRELLTYAEKLLRMRGEMLNAISEKAVIGGILRLGVSETIVHTWLSQFIERVNRSYPQLGFEIEVDTSPNLRERLLAQEIDLAFLLGPFAAPSVRSLPLCQYPVAFVASPLIRWPRKQVTMRDLAAWPIITFSRNTQPYAAVRELFSGADLPPVRLHASASLWTVVRLALDGIGIAVIPPAIVQGELAAGRLRVIKVDQRIPDLAYVASWRSGSDFFVAETVATMATEIAANRALANPRPSLTTHGTPSDR